MISNLFFSLFLIQQGFNTLPDFDHGLAWKTLETEHFYFHFAPSLMDPALRLAEMAEPIRDRLTQKFRSSPSGKVHIVLSDFTDESNGLSSPLPYNLIYLYITPPADEAGLDNYDDWLRMLFTHEFTHSVHIDMAGGINSFLRMIFGGFIVPNAAQQQWAIEGLAELEETLETTRGRGRSPFVESYLRAASLENKFLSIDRATYWHDHYPFGNAAYFYGIGFYQYLVKIYGEEKIYDFTRTTSRSVIPSFFNFKTSKIFGKSFSRLWEEWKADEKQKWEAFRLAHPTPPLKPSPLKAEERLEGIPAWSADGKTLFASISGSSSNAIKAFRFENSKVVSDEVLLPGVTPRRLFFYKDFLIYSRMNFVDRFRRYSDVYALDLKTKKAHRLTRGLRLRDPIVTENSIIAVRTESLKSSLVRFKLPADLASEDEKLVLSDPSQLELLYSAEGFDSISKPSASTDGRHLVFSMRREMKDRQIFLLPLESKKIKQLTSGPFEAHSPTFTPSGSAVLFSSARPLGQKTSTLVSNIFSLRLSDGETTPVTQVLTGADWPSEANGQLAFGHFRSTGFELLTTPYQEDVASKEISTRYPEVSTTAEQPAKSEKASAITDYKKANSLLPHFLFPFFFYTESDFAIGATTLSFDPLRTHFWGATAYYLSAPNRPGGQLTYTYEGFDHFDLTANLSASITDYGNVLFYNSASGLHVFPDHYFERTYLGDFGFSSRLYSSNGFTGFSIGDSLYYEYRTNLLDLPAGTLSGRRDITSGGQTVATDVLRGPEMGKRYGTSGFISYQTNPIQNPAAESPSFGSKIRLRVDYSPELAGSDFKQLTTLLDGKTYLEIADGHYFAATTAAGLQWFHPLYQRSFQLGGSFGESPFANVNKRLHPLRGMETGEFRGEGLLTGSMEYRFALFRMIPGFGTAPIWFKNLHSAFFVDAGQAFEWKSDLTLVEFFTKQMHSFGWDRFSVSSGAELRSNVSITYAPPLLFRLGYGHVLYLEGDWIGTQNVHQVYFAAGTSF